MRVIFIFLLAYSNIVNAQDSSCHNKLGVWLWHVETTGLSHELLANNLSNLGVQRIYVKVADGRVNPDRWTELVDTGLVRTYKEKGLEVWAWSYNYPENDSLQAEALYMAAQTGYDGFVVDVEIEFDANPLALHNLFFAFYQAKARAVNDGIAVDTFNLYCTTWGNPQDHNFGIGIINPYVTGFMPQTYVEVWSSNHIDRITECIEEGDAEYALLGATRPIHHICATQDGSMTPDQINEFVKASGGETSLWRIPGGGTPLSIWQDWQEVEWEQDFCEGLVDTEAISSPDFSVYPNPTYGQITFSGLSTSANSSLLVYNSSGQLIKSIAIGSNQSLDLSGLASGMYWVKPESDGMRVEPVKVVVW